MNNQENKEVIKEEVKLSPNYKLAKTELERITKSGLKQEVLNLLFKEAIETELVQREQIYQKLDTKLQVINENHWLSQENEKYRQRLAKMGRWLIFGKSEQLKGIWKKIQRHTTLGKLGVESRINLIKGHKDADCVISIYTGDYSDEAEVKNVREKLRELGFAEPLQYQINFPNLTEGEVKYLI
jgi:regulator of replication initiation timing